tara:strand:+ start:362 stop:463 length:102 start_codon:yes stop_codon:yes gene_type:complete
MAVLVAVVLALFLQARDEAVRVLVVKVTLEVMA